MSDQNENTSPQQPMVEVDGQQMDYTHLEEMKKTLPKNQRIQEITPGKFKTLTRYAE